MVAYVLEDLEHALRRQISADDWGHATDLLRRAERELTLLVGDLSGFDQTLVTDTLYDSIREEWRNPDGYRSETDDSYSYTRFQMPSGIQGRFWWPINLYDLFGVEPARKAGRTLPLPLAGVSRGWPG